MMANILLLGAGLVTRPLVRYLLDQPRFHVTVATRTVSKAETLVAGHPRGKTQSLLADDTAKLESLIGAHDIVVSLLPAPLHPLVAEKCIKCKKHMVTTSYLSEPMKSLDWRAREAGVMILNEIGVDPGIDHMSAMRIIHEVQSRGGNVVSFRSCCGGIPAPEANNNPWGYKFSWSPRAVCTACKSAARYQLDGKIVDVPAFELFTDSNHGMHIEGVGYLEAYPNRDSLGYIDLYGLERIETMFRGTFRWPGWCGTLSKIVDLGVLDETPTTYPPGTTFAQFIAGFLGQKTDNLREDVARRLNLEVSSPVLDRFEWLGLFGDEEIAITGGKTTPLDVLSAQMERRMRYEPDERDMIVLRHEFVARFPEGLEEFITSTMVDYGLQPEADSSMARTVSLPAAVATKLVLAGEITVPGVHIPVAPAIYSPVLKELATMNIKCVETIEEG